MGTLGQYLRNAREARGIDLRDAAQQTRIGLAYLKALEAEDFSRLPGEVFVKGFLKNYGKFLCLDELEVMKRFGELRPPISASSVTAATEPPVKSGIKSTPRSIAIEPFIFGAGILIAFVIIFFVFTSQPERHQQEMDANMPPAAISQPDTTPVPPTEKLYLEVIALENTWVLVRTDNSPQKKAVLQKDESLTWSADERFLLSYGSANALKLTLNGRELVVNEPGIEVVRDLQIVASGIVDRNMHPEKKFIRKNIQLPDQQAQAQSQELIGSQQTVTTVKPKQAPLFGPPAP